MVKVDKVRRGRSPVHPGAILKEDVLPALKLSVIAAAERLGVTRQALHNVLSGRAAVSPEMAARIGKLCGNGPMIWLRMQNAYDLWQVEHEKAAEIAKIETLNEAA